jgi:hypothetical protein
MEEKIELLLKIEELKNQVAQIPEEEVGEKDGNS